MGAMSNGSILVENLNIVRANIKGVMGQLKTQAHIIERGVGGREVSLAVTNLELTEMWIAKAMFLIEEAKSVEPDKTQV